MIPTLISLLVAIIIVGIVAAILLYIVDMLPLPAPFNQVARVLIMLVALLVILSKALPLLGVPL